MEVMKRIALYLIGIVVFIAFVNGFVDESKELYTLVQQQKDAPLEQIVQGKTAERDLFGRMIYYGLFEEETETNVIYKNPASAYAQVSRDEFEQLEVGETIEGRMLGTAFSDRDVRSKLYEHLILMGVFLIYPFFFVIYQLIHIPVVERWMKRHDKLLGRLISSIFIGGICLGLLFSYISMGKSLFSTIQAHGGKQQEITALITDRDFDLNAGRYVSSQYFLALAYEDQDGNMVHMTKEVPPSVYHNNELFLTVSHPEGYPYRIHLNGFNAGDIFFYMGTDLFIYGLTIVMTALLIFAAVLWRRKKKTGSYWPEHKKKQSLL
ncbi:hypothetical protein [Oceanobacillus polygoni]|uniref:Uncharacterized protein n=1 Tax=Oceanobacillus polygoni TaxID=1235259 RepID=A0A9X0YVU2_9BACI|nr:hypothetical protein [Oceanobacillus polygoni]MBP2079608.1 hypothetical protein [Oceanobacillus polygoni]